MFVHVGGCGVRLGVAIWERVAVERASVATGDALDAELRGLDALFAEAAGGVRPRAIFADLDPEALRAVQSHPAFTHLGPEAFVAGSGGTSRRWADGYGAQALVDAIATAVRREVDACTELQGFVVVHGAAGGTGGGLGARVLEHLRAEYPDATIATFSVLSATAREAPAHAVNQARSLAVLGRHADLCFILGSDAADSILFRERRLDSPTHAERNELFTAAISDVVFAWCSPTGMNLRDMAVTARPFPRTNYLALAHSPYSPRGGAVVGRPLPELVEYAFDANAFLAALDPRHGKYLSSICLVRGDVSEVEAHAIVERQVAHAAHVEWIWDPWRVRISKTPPLGAPRSVTLVATTTAIQEVLKENAEAFALARRAPEGAVDGWRDDPALDDAADALEEAIERNRTARELRADGTSDTDGSEAPIDGIDPEALGDE
ncbi:hypothetical protein L6R52_17430 [Myxococcota bacterium]|nr:hypothetical protein [Myxococcota bacterium]